MKTFALSLAVSLGFLLVTVESIRRRKIKEHTAVLWLSVSGVMVLLSISLPLHWLDPLSHLFGIAVPSNLVLLLAVLFLVILVFHLSTRVAHLTEKTTALVQEIGLLTAREPVAGAAPDSGNEQEGASAAGRGVPGEHSVP